MSGPDEIWIDSRLVRNFKTEPDLDAPEDVEQLRYVSSERLAALVRSAAGGDEFFIQILLDAGTLIGLTNYGRIFHHEPDALAWFEIPVPEIEP